ncbi:MAG: sulfatase [Treponema sp.]|nr:sulfatase [Treponema sp.]
MKPNIIFILIDDLGWRDLGCYNSYFYETPVIDRLAHEGMRFTNAYASCPVCSPTRASIMTGRYPARIGVTNYIGGKDWGRLLEVPYVHELPLSEKSLASALRDGGYATWHIGKWHLGDEPYWPEKHGFDINIGGCQIGHPWHGYWSPWSIPNLPDGHDGEYLTDNLTDHALNLIRTRDKNKPFYLNLWHYAVHTPIQAPGEDIVYFKEKAEKLGLDKRTAIVEGEYYPGSHMAGKRIQRRIVQSDPVYAAMILNLDRNIGRVLDEVRNQAIENETIIIFVSDNGGESSTGGSPTCNKPLAEGKGWMYEGGSRVPQIIKWNGYIKPDSICSDVVTSTDFYPTLLECAGLPLLPEQHLDGISILPLLTKNHFLNRDAIFWHYPHYGNQGGTPGCAIRKGKYKLIRFYEDNHLELYDLEKDLSEKNDLALAKPGIAAELNGLLTVWLGEVCAKIPEPDPKWKPI